MRTKTDCLRIFVAILINMASLSSNAQKEELEVESFKQGCFLFKIEPDGNSVSVEWNKESEISGHIEIPSKVTNNSQEYIVRSINDLAFYGCYNITTLSIPSTIEEISSDAFSGCNNLSELNISSVTPLGYLGIFQETPWYYNLPDGPIYIGTMFAGFKGEEPTGSFNVKEGTTAICRGAFGGCFSLTNVNLPNTVGFIGEHAFDGCINLTSINLPHTVTTIEEGAFADCEGLIAIEIPTNVTSIGRYAFHRCTGLQSIIIPRSIKCIEESTFGGCSNLTSVEIPQSVKSIGEYAFADCSSLSSVTIPNSVSTIGEGAFSGTRLNNINIPNSVKTISSKTFENCNLLSVVHLPDSLMTIGLHAFEGCAQLESISIPESVVLIGKDAFARCKNLTEINCAKENKKIDTLQIPLYYKVIDFCVYSDKPRMMCHIVNHNELQICGFEQDVEECYIPSKIDDNSILYSVTSIASKAFANCKKLHAVYIPNEVREISNDAFAGCTNLEYIFIPLGSITQFPKKIPSELWSKLYERNFSEVGKYRDTVPTRFTVPEIMMMVKY